MPRYDRVHKIYINGLPLHTTRTLLETWLLEAGCNVADAMVVTKGSKGKTNCIAWVDCADPGSYEVALKLNETLFRGQSKVSVVPDKSKARKEGSGTTDEIGRAHV